jgi:hypothetical protein
VPPLKIKKLEILEIPKRASEFLKELILTHFRLNLSDFTATTAPGLLVRLWARGRVAGNLARKAPETLDLA